MPEPQIDIRRLRPSPAEAAVLTPGALDFVVRLEQEFGQRRHELLALRAARQLALDAGEKPNFIPATEHLRFSQWQIAPVPPTLHKRHVEITGPTDRKMLINALNSGADVFMADFEDSNAPTWDNMVQGQQNLQEAVGRTLAFTSPEGKSYRLNEQVATLFVRPRGWHLPERHLLVNGQPVSASLFDFGLYFFHNAQTLLDKGAGPYFYLPKLESHLEARLWNEVFNFAQDALSIPRGTIKATVLIETILAAFEMHEILHELRDHSAGLNAGRWDYIFSCIKKLRRHNEVVFPDRAQVTMTAPFMRAYTELLVRTCHVRGAHAMGGMAAFIPSRKDAQVNELALAKVREDKQREVGDGFDGTWVAHPDLVPVAREIFNATLGEKPNQLERLREDVRVMAADLVNFEVPGGNVTEAGLRANINVGIQYIESWLRGTGAAAIYNLMEDAATAEISRAQVWQWLHRPGQTVVTPGLYQACLMEELEKIKALVGRATYLAGRYGLATELFDQLVTDPDCADFLTLGAYGHLE